MILPACLDAQIGPGVGLTHDIAMVQAMLTYTDDIAGRPYWTGAVDGEGSDGLGEAIERFQEDFDLLDQLDGDLRSVVSPESATLHCMREASAPVLQGLRAVPGTATLYLPPRSGAQVLRTLTAKLRGSGYAGDVALGRCLAVLAERVFDRHRFLLRFPVPAETAHARRVPIRAAVQFFGLRWIAVSGRIVSSEGTGHPVPPAFADLAAAEIRNLGPLKPEPAGTSRGGGLWLRYET